MVRDDHEDCGASGSVSAVAGEVHVPTPRPSSTPPDASPSSPEPPAPRVERHDDCFDAPPNTDLTVKDDHTDLNTG